MKRKKYTYKDCVYFKDRTNEICIDKKDKAVFCSRYGNNYCRNSKCIFLRVLNKHKGEMKEYPCSINTYFDD